MELIWQRRTYRCGRPRLCNTRLAITCLFTWYCHWRVFPGSTRGWTPAWLTPEQVSRLGIRLELRLALTLTLTSSSSLYLLSNCGCLITNIPFVDLTSQPIKLSSMFPYRKEQSLYCHRQQTTQPSTFDNTQHLGVCLHRWPTIWSYSRAYQGQTLNLLPVIREKGVNALLSLSSYLLARSY